jgi:hypothetical protein
MRTEKGDGKNVSLHGRPRNAFRIYSRDPGCTRSAEHGTSVTAPALSPAAVRTGANSFTLHENCLNAEILYRKTMRLNIYYSLFVTLRYVRYSEKKSLLHMVRN